MFRPWGVFIGARYTGSRRGSRLTTFLSRCAIAGLVIGVALLILVLSVMNGFEREMRLRILGLVPHVTLYPAHPDVDWRLTAEQVAAEPGVAGVAPLVQLNGMLMKGERVATTLLLGVDPERERGVTALPRFIEAEALARLAHQPGSLVLGRGLAEQLGAAPGDRITVIVPRADGGARPQPRIQRFSVAGLLESGTELDESLVLIELEAARGLGGVGEGGVALRVMLDDLFAAPTTAHLLRQSLGHRYIASDWTLSQGNLYTAIRMSKQLVGMMLAIIIAVAAFNVVSALVLVVNDKQGDIAILRSQGATGAGIVQIFLVQGFLVGLIGTALGVAIGVGLSLLVTDAVALLERALHIQFLKSDVYPITHLPADLRLVDISQVAGTALLVSSLAALYPAWRAARIAPAQALRYD
jgi:lipoprotein-releasing system permease protein